MTIDQIKLRAGFGEERYESEEFQKKVAAVYEKIYDPSYWKRFSGADDKEILHKSIAETVTEAIKKGETKFSSLF